MTDNFTINCFVINLPRSKDRLEFISRQLEELNVRFEVVSALDKKFLTSDEIASFRKKAGKNVRHHQWTESQIAVITSHRMAWQRVADGDTRYGAIFEDDVHFSRNLGAILSRSEWDDKEIPSVRLETTLQSVRLSSESEISIGGRKLFRLMSEAWGAAAYILSRQAARTLLEAPVASLQPIDWFLFHPSSWVFRTLHTHQMVPAPCIQDQFLPDESRRIGFSMETKSPSPVVPASRIARSVVRPLVRAIRRRVVVPYYNEW